MWYQVGQCRRGRVSRRRRRRRQGGLTFQSTQKGRLFSTPISKLTHPVQSRTCSGTQESRRSTGHAEYKGRRMGALLRLGALTHWALER